MTDDLARSQPPDGSPFKELERDFGWTVRQLALTFGDRATAAIADLPQGPRGYLVLIAVAEGRLRSQLALAQRLRIDKTALTYLLDALEQEGLVVRQPDATDRRVRVVEITAAGADALQRTRADLHETENSLLDVLDTDDATLFRWLLRRIAEGALAARD